MSILFDFNKAAKSVRMTVNGAYRKGTPVDVNGTLANDGNAYGIVAEDTNDRVSVSGGLYTYLATVIISGYVDLEEAQKSFGSLYADACKSALSNIVFTTDGKLPTPSSEPELIEFTATVTEDEEDNTTVNTCSKTYSDILALINANKQFYVSVEYTAPDDYHGKFSGCCVAQYMDEHGVINFPLGENQYVSINDADDLEGYIEFSP